MVATEFTIEEIIDTLGEKTNKELARYVKNDIVTNENFGLDINQARFLMEIAVRLEGCTCFRTSPLDRLRTSQEDVPPFLSGR